MSERYQKTYPISWEQLHRDSKALAWRLLDQGEWQGIVAITRGGLVPAAVIARELELHVVDTICISSYQWKDQGKIKILKSFDGDGDGWLLVDDLVDTFITEVSQDTWILFPWDTESQFVEPISNRMNEGV